MTIATRGLLVGGVAVLAASGAMIWSFYGSGHGRSDPTNPVLVALGKIVYAQHCAACHGANLEGEPNWRERLPNGRLPAPPHDAEGHTWHHPDKVLFEITKNGVGSVVPGYESDMPAFKGVLTDREIWAVISFIESTWPPDIRERQERMSRRAD